MIVCVCEGIGHRELLSRIESGADTVEDLGEESGVGRSCGQCVRALERLIDSSTPEAIRVEPHLTVCAK